VQVVLAGFTVDVLRFAGEQRAGRVHPLLVRLQHPRDRVLRKPVDGQIWVQLAKLPGDGQVSLCVPKPDR